MAQKRYMDYLLEQIKDHTGWIIGSITAICGSGMLQIMDLMSSNHFWCYRFLLLFNFGLFLLGIAFLITNIYLTILFADQKIKNMRTRISKIKRCWLKITFHGQFVFTIL
jgi:hypothetical protein